MDMDINNDEALSAGAFYARRSETGDGWRPIFEAPRDGAIIEVRCTYGVAPWFALFRWVDNRWAKVGEDNSSFYGGPSFTWRPYTGDAASYVDPTGGMQNSMAYWRGAVAAKHGLPLDTFERGAARAEKAIEPRGFFRRLFLWD